MKKRVYINEAQFSVLYVIGTHDRLSLIEIFQLVKKIKYNYIQVVLKKLISKNLITPHKVSEKRIYYTITELGKKFLQFYKQF